MSKVIVITGPSAVGKSTLARMCLPLLEDLVVVKSYTTREETSRDKVEDEYHHVSRREFSSLVSEGQLLEYSEYAGNFYGTPVTDYFEWLEKGYSPIKVIDVTGAKSFKEIFEQDVVTVFIKPPSKDKLELRMQGRDGSLDEKRIVEYDNDMSYATYCDYVLVNDKLEDCAKSLFYILAKELDKNKLNIV